MCGVVQHWGVQAALVNLAARAWSFSRTVRQGFAFQDQGHAEISIGSGFEVGVQDGGTFILEHVASAGVEIALCGQAFGEEDVMRLQLDVMVGDTSGGLFLEDRRCR